MTVPDLSRVPLAALRGAIAAAGAVSGAGGGEDFEAAILADSEGVTLVFTVIPRRGERDGGRT